MAKQLSLTTEQRERSKLQVVDNMLSLMNAEIKAESPDITTLLENLINELQTHSVLENGFNRFKALEPTTILALDVVNVGTLTTAQKLIYINAIKNFLVYIKINLI